MPLEILGVTEERFFAFVLILFRMGSLLAFAPIFSSPFVPMRVKAAVALGVSLSLTVLGFGGEVAVPQSAARVALLVGQEILLGFLVGFVARLVFVAVQFGGQLVGFQMGLGIVSVMDPQFEAQISVVSQFQFLLAILLFLAVGGERMLVEAFARNLAEVPPGLPISAGPALGAVARLSAEIFRVGLQVAAPVVVALFAAHVILGVFARSVPQMNMLILGFPLQILVGLAAVGLSLPYWGHTVLRALSDALEVLRGLPAVLR